MKATDIQPGRTYANGNTWRMVEKIEEPPYEPRLPNNKRLLYRTLKGPGRGGTGVLWLSTFAAWARRDVTEEATA